MASYSVLIDRVVGVTVLAILVVVCLPWTLDLIHDPIAGATLALIGFGTLAGAMGFLALGASPLRVTERWWLIRQLAVASRLFRAVVCTKSPVKYFQGIEREG